MSESTPSASGSPTRLNALMITVVLSAIAILCWAGWHVPRHEAIKDMLILTAMAVLLLPLAVVLPITGAVVMYEDIFLMALAMIHGTAACVTATACFGLAYVLFRARRLHMKWKLFHFSGLVCCSFLYSSVYELVRPTYADDTVSAILPAMAMGAVALIFQVGLSATSFTWRTGKGIRTGKFFVYFPLFAVNALLAAMGAMIMATFWRKTLLIPLVAAVPLNLMWAWTWIYRSRVARHYAS